MSSEPPAGQGTAGEKDQVIQRCVACGACLDNCPLFPGMRYHNHGAGTLAGEIVAFLRGGPLTPAARDTLLACDNCGRCADWCPVHVAPTIFRAGRQALASHDGG